MTNVLPIIKWPDPILETVCQPVGEVTPELHALAHAMLRTIESTDGYGIGLSAPQVGQAVRLLVMQVATNRPVIMFNPQIVKTSKGKTDSKEGCLSFPGKEVTVRRWKWVTVEYLNGMGAPQHHKFYGLEAFCIQHEIDHLNGITLNDYT